MNYEQQIKKLAAEKNAIILAHNYQPAEIQDVADICGDSLELARLAKEAKESTLVLCGVYFMAETAKILSPEKTVLIPRPEAGCPLADQLTPEMVRHAKAEHPGSPFVVYVNSNAATKAECDITCTSANAAVIAASLPEKRILFGPMQTWRDGFSASCRIRRSFRFRRMADVQHITTLRFAMWKRHAECIRMQRLSAIRSAVPRCSRRVILSARPGIWYGTAGLRMSG